MLPAGAAFGVVFAYSAMCNLFPQGRPARMVHLSLCRGFFFFFLEETSPTPHQREDCLLQPLLYLTGAFELHDVSEESLDSSLCKFP